MDSGDFSAERIAVQSGQILRYRFRRLVAIAAVLLRSGAVLIN